MAGPTVALSVLEAQRWVSTVKVHKTADGHTIAAVLALVEKRSHGRFKVAGYDVFYVGNGKLSSVAILYWIGTKRNSDLVFTDLDYPMNHNGTIATLSLRERPTLQALEKGADAMRAAVEEHYRANCPAKADLRSDNF